VFLNYIYNYKEIFSSGRNGKTSWLGIYNDGTWVASFFHSATFFVFST